jgi:hypothetical protein
MIEYKPVDPKKTKFLMLTGNKKAGLSDIASMMFIRAGKEPERIRKACDELDNQLRALLGSPQLGSPEARAKMCARGVFHKNFHEHKALIDTLTGAAKRLEEHPDERVFSISFDKQSENPMWTPDLTIKWHPSA